MQSAPLFLYIEDNFLRIFRIDEQIVASVPSALFEIFRVFLQHLLLHLLLHLLVVRMRLTTFLPCLITSMVFLL